MAHSAATPPAATSDELALCRQLIAAATDSRTPEHAEYILHEICSHDVLGSADWHQYITPSVRRIWAKLDIGQRLILYLAAYDLGD